MPLHPWVPEYFCKSNPQIPKSFNLTSPYLLPSTLQSDVVSRPLWFLIRLWETWGSKPKLEFGKGKGHLFRIDWIDLADECFNIKGLMPGMPKHLEISNESQVFCHDNKLASFIAMHTKCDFQFHKSKRNRCCPRCLDNSDILQVLERILIYIVWK